MRLAMSENQKRRLLRYVVFLVAIAWMSIGSFCMYRWAPGAPRLREALSALATIVAGVAAAMTHRLFRIIGALLAAGGVFMLFLALLY